MKPIYRLLAFLLLFPLAVWGLLVSGEFFRELTDAVLLLRFRMFLRFGLGPRLSLHFSQLCIVELVHLGVEFAFLDIARAHLFP